MAVEIIKDLLPINPAYNDSIVTFYSNDVSGTKAEVVVNGTTFTVTPFLGQFTFNFKEIVKSLINTNRFADTKVPDLSTGNFLISDSSFLKTISVTFRVYNSLGGVQALNKSYFFYRGVEQLPDYHRLSQLTPTVRCFLPTTNYVDYYCKYHEGYPFDFAVTIPTFSEYYFKNITTNQVTPTYTNLSFSSGRRVYLSDGANTTTETDILIQSSTVNKLELFVNDVFQCNIYVAKVESDCGVYLKWLNSKGTYSYWKFDSIYKSTITPKTIDDFGGYYDNLQNITSSSSLIGKTATQTLSVSTIYNSDDAKYLADLTYSPAVWMYVHNEPFMKMDAYSFVGVKVNDSAFVNVDTKNNKGKCNLTITLPALNTITN